MRRARVLPFVMLALVACSSDRAAAPDPVAAPARTTTTTGTTVTTLLWEKPYSTPASVSKTIGPDGGSLAFKGGGGLRLTVPKGAVSANTTFRITRLAGRIVAYDFEPHGIVFKKEVIIEQPSLGTNLFKQSATATIEGMYFADPSLLDQGSGTATVSEFQPTFVSADNAWIVFSATHFSGYGISTGRVR